MVQVPDRKKLRREYLRKKRKALREQAIYALGMLIALGSFLLLVGLGVVILLCWLGGAFKAYRFSSFYVACTCLTLSLISVLFLAMAYQILLLWSQIAAQIPDIPPVTADTLPADEILVRASVEPLVVQSEVLLRGAQGQETQKEELLRVVAE